MAASPSFDTLALAEELERAGFPPGQARGAAHAFAGAIGQDLATKSDVRDLDHKLELLRRDLESLRRDTELLGDRIVNRLGRVIIACTGLLAVLVGLARWLP